MTSNSRPILTDTETMEMFIAFYSEALEFLKVPKELWAELKMGFTFDVAEKKAKIISINYPKSKILVCLPALKALLQDSVNNNGDAPSLYRFYGYKIARLWQQYLKTGQHRVLETDKDSFFFAKA